MHPALGTQVHPPYLLQSVHGRGESRCLLHPAGQDQDRPLWIPLLRPQVLPHRGVEAARGTAPGALKNDTFIHPCSPSPLRMSPGCGNLSLYPLLLCEDSGWKHCDVALHFLVSKLPTDGHVPSQVVACQQYPPAQHSTWRYAHPQPQVRHSAARQDAASPATSEPSTA